MRTSHCASRSTRPSGAVHRSASFEFWKLTKGASVAVCALWDHPLGAEVRCDVDGEMRRTKASRELGQLLDASDEWQKAFEEKGWT
jgi:hypothetical protein